MLKLDEIVMEFIRAYLSNPDMRQAFTREWLVDYQAGNKELHQDAVARRAFEFAQAFIDRQAAVGVRHDG